MSDLNIFAPPPDATLDRIVAANRPRVMARVRRHWWQSLSAKRSFSILSGLSLFAAGALVSAAVLVPQLHPGETTFSVYCYGAEGAPVAHKIWGGKDAPPNTATRAEAQADPAAQCGLPIQSQLGEQAVRPIVVSLIGSGHLCGWISTRTGERYGFGLADPNDHNSFSIIAPMEGNYSVQLGPPGSKCPTFKEPIDIPVVGPLVACRANATTAAVYVADDRTQYAVCQQHSQPIWTGEGR